MSTGAWLPLVLALAAYIFHQYFLDLLLDLWNNRKPIPSFPSLPNPHPILGDLRAFQAGFKRHGGLRMYLEELTRKLGPNFQLWILGKRSVRFPSPLSHVFDLGLIEVAPDP